MKYLPEARNHKQKLFRMRFEFAIVSGLAFASSLAIG
jgi:hypothetical protein